MWNGCFLGEDSVYLLLLWIVLEIGIFEGIEMEKVRLLNELLLDFEFRFELFALFTLESWVQGNENRNGILNIASKTKRHLPHRKKNLSKIRKKNSVWYQSSVIFVFTEIVYIQHSSLIVEFRGCFFFSLKIIRISSFHYIFTITLWIYENISFLY